MPGSVKAARVRQQNFTRGDFGGHLPQVNPAQKERPLVNLPQSA